MSKHLLFVVALLLAGCGPTAANAETQATSTISPANAERSTPTPIPEIMVGVVQVDTLNVREGPGTSYPTVGSLTQGEKFQVLGDVINSTNNRWLIISSSSISRGWVIGDQTYVVVQKELVDLNTYLTWQKNVAEAKVILTTLTAIP